MCKVSEEVTLTLKLKGVCETVSVTLKLTEPLQLYQLTKALTYLPDKTFSPQKKLLGYLMRAWRLRLPDLMRAGPRTATTALTPGSAATPRR